MAMALEFERITDAVAVAPDEQHGPRLSEVPPEALLDAYSAAVVRVAKQVGPAVVNIAVVQQRTARSPHGDRSFATAGTGSGVIIAPDGHVLTNNHVVDHAARVEVTLADGRTVPAAVVGTDPPTDLAVIRMHATALPA